MTDPSAQPGTSARVAGLRQAVFGPRGRAAFARALGVSPSTYNYYEKNRPPPADLLARAARVTGADLTWLLTGAGEPFPQAPLEGADNRLSHPAEEIIARFAEVLAARHKLEHDAEAAGHSGISRGSRRGLEGGAPRVSPNAAVAALRAILGQVEKSLPVGSAWKASEAGLSPSAIPVVGRTAAGLLAPWEEFFAGEEDSQAMERLIAQT